MLGPSTDTKASSLQASELPREREDEKASKMPMKQPGAGSLVGGGGALAERVFAIVLTGRHGGSWSALRLPV